MMDAMGRFSNNGARRNNYATRLIAFSIMALAMTMAILFFGQFLHSDPSSARNASDRDVHARRLMHERDVHKTRKLSLVHYGDPKSVVLREEQKKITQLAAEVNEMQRNLVQCDSDSKKGWLNQGSSVQLDTIPEFWANDNCFHDFSHQVTFFHVGKAGGGTVERELLLSRIGFTFSHPGPKANHIEQLQRGPLNTLILNVRDPVDRYVSAFRWGLNMLCGPKKAHNKRCKSPAFVEGEWEEWILMGERYNGDPNVLAEALCEESPIYNEAMEDYSKMLFMGHKRPLTSWLEILLEPSREGTFSEEGIQHLIAVPMEKQIGNDVSLFNQHNQKLALHLLQTRYGPEKANEILMQRPNDTDLAAKARMEHSAGKSDSPALSPLGKCCMARQLRGDYQLIQTMLGYDSDSGNKDSLIVEPLSYAHPSVLGACSWGSEDQQELCRSDLRSMLTRRARYLDPSLGTCSNAVAGVGST